ncbi:MAG: TetR/AcrR family transcriptional regulator [Blautia sp.]|jgi:AcrR family transcriptional regulator
MGTKGNQTKRQICTAAYSLFVQKGFKDVTMQDICQKTGLSRGGLYRHYSSTEQIFSEIISALMASQRNEFQDKIRQQIPAQQILKEVLDRYEKEMLDCDASLSLAIYEFFSQPETASGENSLFKQYLASKQMWMELLEYGIQTKAFRKTDPEAVFDLIIFSYQGVRMYSRMMPVDPSIPHRIVHQIKNLLLFTAEREDSL